jgi:hypothetical protein
MWGRPGKGLANLLGKGGAILTMIIYWPDIYIHMHFYKYQLFIVNAN